MLKMEKTYEYQRCKDLSSPQLAAVLVDRFKDQKDVGLLISLTDQRGKYSCVETAGDEMNAIKGFVVSQFKARDKKKALKSLLHLVESNWLSIIRSRREVIR